MRDQGESSPIRILSLDGGGIRGYAQALLLESLEREMGTPIAEAFDVIAGTSIGALIGAGLARPVGDDEHWSQAKEIAMEFRSHGRDIFDPGKVEAQIPKKFDAGLRKILTSWEAKENESLNELISKLRLDEFKLSEAIREFVAPAYDVSDDGMDEGEAIVIFSSSSARERGEEITLGTVARASSAAPMYFPPEKAEWNGKSRALIDGGIFANNPAMVALTQVWAKEPRRPVRILSIGTGTDVDRGVYDRNKDGEYSAPNHRIARKSVSLILEATSQASLSLIRDFQSEPGSGVDLCSIQPRFSKGVPGLDQADDEAMGKIEDAASAAWEKEGEKMVSWIQEGNSSS